MLDALLEGFSEVLTPWVLLHLLLGVLIGLLVGVLPGLGGPAALALVLPFTFGMEPAAAFAVMLGLTAVVSLAGDLTSILFGVPGEATSAALVVDGYPMTRRGEAGRAVGAALVSSLVGAVFGVGVLLAVIPVVRPLVLGLQSPELFMLTVLGLAFVAVLSRGNRLKGLIVAAVGLLVATVGLDPQTGISRFTFGQVGLWDGIGIVSVAMGLFAIPELLTLVLGGGGATGRRISMSDVARGARDVGRNGWLTLRCSAIGAAVGIIPGLGGAVGQWVAYGHAAQSSRNRAQFGHGAVEGVIGPSAAGNSKEGGSLVPTIAFGIPGGTMMAILLGGMLIQGVVPGPAMLGENLSLTMSFVAILLLANLVGVALCLPLAGRIATLASLRTSILLPVITVFVFVGAYAQQGQVIDIWLMLVFGAIGIVMVARGWPRPPLVLGLVLGELSERYLFRAVAGEDWAWLTRPSVLVLTALVVLVVMSGTLPRRRRPVTPAGVEVDSRG